MFIEIKMFIKYQYVLVFGNNFFGIEANFKSLDITIMRVTP